MGYGKHIYHTGGLAVILLLLTYASSLAQLGGISGGVLLPAGSACVAPTTVSGLNIAICRTATVTATSDGTAGGAWTSSSTTIATVNSSTGNVKGQSGGSCRITYTNSCGSASSTVTINPTITGTLHCCLAATSTLTGTPAGGTWSSSNTSRASVGSSSGVVTGGVAGSTANITYTQAGCTAVSVFTVDALPLAIGGNTPICVGYSISLTNGTSGGGTWSGNNTSIATISASSGSPISVLGVSAGNTNITFTRTNGCIVTATLTVNATPTITLGASPSVIIGTTSADLPYTATTATPTTYDIVYDATAHGQGFGDVTGAALTASPITLDVPVLALPDTYNGTITVTNASGCVELSPQPFTVTITP